MADLKYSLLNIEKEKDKEGRTPTPYRINLNLKNKKLICLGVKHTKDILGKQSKIVLECLKESKVVLVETYNREIKKDNEIDFIIEKANEMNISIVECDLHPLKAISLAYNKSNGRKIILLRILMYLNKPERKKNLDKNIEDVIKIIKNEEFFSEIFEKENLTKEKICGLLNNFLIKNNKKRINEIDEADNIFPTPVENKTPLNKIIRKVSYIRDNNMLEKLEETLLKFNNVSYILGKNHIIRQEEVIKEIFKRVTSNPPKHHQFSL
jgi:hypothetical protein